MSAFARDLARLDRAVRRLAGNPSVEAAVGAGDRYPDGRTIPRVGDAVFTAIPGMFGSTGSMSGTVVRRRDGSLGVQVREMNSLLGGRQGFKRAKTYPFGRAWTVSGEKGADELAQEKAKREHDARHAAWKQGRDEADAAFRREQAKAKAAGRLLSDATPRAGMRVRDLRREGVATIWKSAEPPGPYEDTSLIHVRFDGERYGDDEADTVVDPSEWVVLR